MTLQFDSQGAEPQSRELDESREQRLRHALRAGGVGVWEWNLETGNIHWDSEISESFSDLHDHPARELLRRVERHDRRRLLKAIRAAIGSQKPLAVEVRILGRNGETRWIAVRGAPAETVARKVTALAGVAYDVTDQKLSLTRTDALLREVSHRSKNLLALILAMARLTARDAIDVKSHLKDFTLRVAGLSASQDLIVASDWQSVDLATLAAAEIGAVARTDADRVAIKGPPVMLTPEAAQTLGMVLTELALNAVEHGALSAATGEVNLEWTLPDPTTILISWRETGGPPFLADGPKGYGMSVVERFSTQGLKLSARADGNADEFTWTLTGPLAHVGHAQKAAIKT
ncbi:sensor histidine kinase [Hyphomicrobium sp. 2TAF46]|uniref:sensor histidine kinase n=1 Tax=Hyphomicrobium sp. 2TAF46 TaxID=3233019 RepID=UPI003F9362B9